MPEPVAVAPPSLRIERVGYGHRDALLLIEEVQQEYVRLYGGRDSTPLDPAMFEPPGGSFYVGYLEDLPVATGAWRARSDVEAFGSLRTAEIKRMYVAPSARAGGHARAMLAHLERAATAAGAEVMILETGKPQVGAIALYESAGYTLIPSFGHYKWSPENRCFGRRMTAVEGPAS